MTLTHKNLQRLGNDLRHIARDLEGLLKEIPKDLSDEAGAARKRLEGTLDSVKEFGHRLEEKTRAGVAASYEYVQENPWQTLATVIGIGLLVGVLLSRKS